MNANDPRTYAIIGAAMEVHTEQGCGFLEPVYQESLELAMAERGIPFEREVDVRIWYKDRELKTRYRADFIGYGSIIVEVKALDALTGHEEAQLLNYLKATGMEVGLLLNFGASSLQTKRMIRHSAWRKIEPKIFRSTDCAD